MFIVVSSGYHHPCTLPAYADEVIGFPTTSSAVQIDSAVMAGRRWWTSDPAQISWILPSAVFDPSLWPSTGLPGDRTPPPKALDRPRHLTQPQDAWIKNSVDIFLGQIWPGVAGVTGERSQWPSQARRYMLPALVQDEQWIVRSGVFSITGVTRTCAGATLGGCQVLLYRTSDDAFIGSTTSDINGNYSFAVSDNTTKYFLVAYFVDAPDVAGTTRNDITGV